MNLRDKLAELWASSAGRISLTVSTAAAVLAAATLVAVTVFPASAGSGAASVPEGVAPYEVDLGGQPGDCEATVTSAIDGPGDPYPGLPSSGTYAYRIVNLADGVRVDIGGETWVRHDDPGPGGASIYTRTFQGGRLFDWFIEGGSVEDIIVKGGSNSTHWPILDQLDTRLTADGQYHAPTRSNGQFYSASHAEFCYSTLASISGTKFRDNDTDGEKDPSFEDGLGGWTISVYDGGALAGSAVTAADGSYTISDLQIGETYTVCEGDGVSTGLGGEFSWTQSDLSLVSGLYPTWVEGVCSGFPSSEPDGHQFALLGDTPGIDFGNHLEVTIPCNGEGVTLALPGAPSSTVTCPSGGPSTSVTSSFDAGQSDDFGATLEDFSQFVVFGGDPTETSVILEQTIEWLPEPANYEDGDLVVPTTQVRLSEGGGVVDVLRCADTTSYPAGDGPYNETGKTDCLFSRVVNEGGDSLGTDIQLTETYKFFGDPPRFR